MRSSSWWHSQVSEIMPFNTPTTEHFFLLTLSLQNTVASACSMTLDRTQIMPIRFSAELCVQRQGVLQSDGWYWFRWMPWMPESIGIGRLAQMCPWVRQSPDFPCFGEFQGTLNRLTPRASCPTQLNLRLSWLIRPVHIPHHNFFAIYQHLTYVYLSTHISGSVAYMIGRCWLVALCKQ